MSSHYTKIPSLQGLLHIQIESLKTGLTQYAQKQFVGALLFGSCCRGEATYRSDIDILLVFEQISLNFSFVQQTRDAIEKHFTDRGLGNLLRQPLRVEFQVVRDSVFQTSDPVMKSNLEMGIILVDKTGFIKKSREAFSE